MHLSLRWETDDPYVVLKMNQKLYFLIEKCSPTNCKTEKNNHEYVKSEASAEAEQNSKCVKGLFWM